MLLFIVTGLDLGLRVLASRGLLSSRCVLPGIDRLSYLSN